MTKSGHLPGVKRRAGALSINLFSDSNEIFCPMDHLFLLQFACFLFMLFKDQIILLCF